MPIKGKENIIEYKKTKFNSIIKILYDNFIEYFINGDLIITGSISYIKLGIMKQKNPSDLDIDIISGEHGDKILYEIINFFKEQYKYEIIMRDMKELRALIKTPYGYIDIFRNDFNNKKNLIEIEIIDGVKTKYYGHEWILNILIDKYIWFIDRDIQSKVLKFKNTINEIYSLINKEELSTELTDKIKEIIL
jgi:hypothetical protein